MTQIIFTFNIRQSVYRQFGFSLFNHVNQHYGMHLLPVVTAPEDGIEQRAYRISQQLPRILQKMKADSVHLASYSTSGIDCRFAISELGMSKYAKTLTTISSPHLGSKLALLSDRKFFKDEHIDPVSKLTGIGIKPFHEFVPENMKNFNNCIKNAPNVEYYSFGSEKLPSLCSGALSETGKYLFLKTQANFQYHNDGVFGHDEMSWGNYITNFEADHGEVIGVYGSKYSRALKTVKQIVNDWESRHQKKQSTQA